MIRSAARKIEPAAWCVPRFRSAFSKRGGLQVYLSANQPSCLRMSKGKEGGKHHCLLQSILHLCIATALLENLD